MQYIKVNEEKVYAIIPIADFDRLVQAAVTQIETRKRSPNGWNYVNHSHVIITVDASRRYLIRLRVKCNGLFGAEVIAFTNTVSYLTTFDQLLVKDSIGILERCPIDSMNELKRVEKAE